jgi:hypothetical protein
MTRGGAEKRRVAVKRKTPHGAETPSLEKVSEASQAVKQAAGELVAALRQLIEKAKRRVNELEKMVEEAERRAEIKLTVKELLEGNVGGREKKKDDDDDDGLEKKLAEVMEDNDRLLQELKQARDENARLVEERERLAKEVDALRDKQRKRPRAEEALKVLKELIGAADSVDYDRLAAEFSKRIPQGAGAASDIDALASMILLKVLERLPSASSGVIRYVPAPPPTVILKKFMEAEVARLEERLRSQPGDVKRVIAYLQAKGVHSTKRDLILRLFGPSFTGGEGYRRVSKIIDDTLATELVREDTAGRLYPNVELKVEGDLRAYEPTKEDVAMVVEHVMHLIAANAVKG